MQQACWLQGEVPWAVAWERTYRSPSVVVQQNAAGVSWSFGWGPLEAERFPPPGVEAFLEKRGGSFCALTILVLAPA